MFDRKILVEELKNGCEYKVYIAPYYYDIGYDENTNTLYYNVPSSSSKINKFYLNSNAKISKTN